MLCTAFACALAGATAHATAAPGRWDGLATPLFAHIGLEQGLPHPVVTALAQDGDGYLWLGTQSGLARWDGYRMRSFRHDPADAASLPGDYILALHADRKGRLWIGTATGGLARFDKASGRFIRIAKRRGAAGGLSSLAVHAIASDGLGGIWAGTAAGLDYIDAAGTVLPQADAAPAMVAGLRDPHIRALHMDRRGVLWIGTAGGLARRGAGVR